MPDAQATRCAWVNVDHVLMREYHDLIDCFRYHDVRRLGISGERTLPDESRQKHKSGIC